MPFRAESSSNLFERIQPENLATACHTLKKASGNGNKRLTEKSGDRKERLTEEAEY
ncbi:hypothetical protein [Bacteroides thetaiotaomicron]|uniref:hypothetical protein n=1 Tax=Bacteroides thetaiotaomicron TaxID=818 RepID=UPI0021662D46|nr:hypothetical protein [Bacteroides thetaiotaomicron]MCS2203468.1 hypothetical protein [Bacteroides thetaiotaomicron]MCS2781481.1 hypothetical protein [Bacteroides thetaiotaomicron]